MGGTPGLVVMGGDSCSKGCGFKSQHCKLDERFYSEGHLLELGIITIPI